MKINTRLGHANMLQNSETKKFFLILDGFKSCPGHLSNHITIHNIKHPLR